MRGIPMIAPAIFNLIKSARYEEAAMQAAFLGAKHFGFITKQNNQADGSTAMLAATAPGAAVEAGGGVVDKDAEPDSDVVRRVDDIKSGQWHRLGDFENPVKMGGDYPSTQFDSFMRRVLLSTSAALNRSYASVTGDTIGHNYSSLKWSLLFDRADYLMLADQLVSGYLGREFEFFLRALARSGDRAMRITEKQRVELIHSAKWLGPIQPDPDASKGSKAAETYLSLGIMAPSNAMRSTGQETVSEVLARASRRTRIWARRSGNRSPRRATSRAERAAVFRWAAAAASRQRIQTPMRTRTAMKNPARKMGIDSTQYSIDTIAIMRPETQPPVENAPPPPSAADIAALCDTDPALQRLLRGDRVISNQPDIDPEDLDDDLYSRAICESIPAGAIELAAGKSKYAPKNMQAWAVIMTDQMVTKGDLRFTVNLDGLDLTRVRLGICPILINHMRAPAFGFLPEHTRLNEFGVGKVGAVVKGRLGDFLPNADLTPEERSIMAIAARMDYADSELGLAHFNAVTQGHIRSVSMGFNPTGAERRYEDADDESTMYYHFTAIEMVELSEAFAPAVTHTLISLTKHNGANPMPTALNDSRPDKKAMPPPDPKDDSKSSDKEKDDKEMSAQRNALRAEEVDRQEAVEAVIAEAPEFDDSVKVENETFAQYCARARAPFSEIGAADVEARVGLFARAQIQGTKKQGEKTPHELRGRCEKLSASDLAQMGIRLTDIPFNPMNHLGTVYENKLSPKFAAKMLGGKLGERSIMHLLGSAHGAVELGGHSAADGEIFRAFRNYSIDLIPDAIRIHAEAGIEGFAPAQGGMGHSVIPPAVWNAPMSGEFEQAFRQGMRDNTIDGVLRLTVTAADVDSAEPRHVRTVSDYFWSALFLGRLGCRHETIAFGKTAFPIEKTVPVAVEADEQATIAASDYVLSDVEMKPKRFGSMLPITDLAGLTASPSYEGRALGAMVMALVRKVENAVINGTGAAGRIKGILAETGIAELEASDLASNFLNNELCVKIVNSLPSRNIPGPRGWLFHPAVRTRAMHAKRYTDDRENASAVSLWDEEKDGMDKFYHHPAAVSTNTFIDDQSAHADYMADGTGSVHSVAFGCLAAWSHAVFGQWSGATMFSHRPQGKAETEWTINCFDDFRIIRPSAFIVSKALRVDGNEGAL